MGKSFVLKLSKFGLLIIFLNSWCSLFSFSQSMQIGFGLNYSYNQINKSVIGGKNFWNDDDNNININLSYPYKKWILMAHYSKTNGKTSRSVPGDIYVYGFVGTDLRYFDLGIGRNLLFENKHLIILPFASLGILSSIKNIYSVDPSIRFSGPLIYQVSGFQSESHSLFQPTGTIGVKLSGVIGRRIEIGFNFHLTYANQVYQKVWFDYYHKDSPTTIRTATFESTGTSYFFYPFIGIKLNNKKK